jgi:hypothetical protein
MPRYRANAVPVHRWQERRFTAPEMGFGEYAGPPGKVAGRFTAGAEGLVVQSIARKENYRTICSEYHHNKKYQIRTDKPMKTCIVLKFLVRHHGFSRRAWFHSSCCRGYFLDYQTSLMAFGVDPLPRKSSLQRANTPLPNELTNSLMRN